MSKDLSATVFRPAVRKRQQSESSGHGNPPPVEANSARGRADCDKPGIESRAASTGSSWLIEDRPTSTELEGRIQELDHWYKSPSGETGESDSEDTRQSRYEGPCRDLDQRIAATAKSKPKESEITGELREKLVLRKALNNDSSGGSLSADDLDFGLPPDAETHLIHTPPETPRSSRREPAVPTRKVINKKIEKPPTKSEVQLARELLKKQGEYWNAPKPFETEPDKYWPGSLEEPEAKKAKDKRLLNAFEEKHAEANARAEASSASTTFFGRAQDRAREEFARAEALSGKNSIQAVLQSRGTTKRKQIEESNIGSFSRRKLYQ